MTMKRSYPLWVVLARELAAVAMVHLGLPL